MIIEALEEYLEILSGYVFDNDKIVTYKWLSKELEVHVNIAKHVLWEFWKRHKKDKNVECTVMLMGSLKSGGMRVEVVKESNLDAAKEKFSKIISEHLYSVQKSLPDMSLLSISGEGDVRYGAIKCEECVERSEEELLMLRWGAMHKEHEHSDEKEPVQHTENRTEASTSSIVNAQSKVTDKKSAGGKKNLTTQKNGLSSFFGKAAEKSKSPETKNTNTNGEIHKAKASDDKKEPSTNEKSDVPTKETKKKPMDRFFEKSIPSAVDNANKNEEKNKNNKVDTNKNFDTNEKQHGKKQTAVSKSTNKDQANKRGIKRSRPKETVSATKKRKRIMTIDDSSDSESHSNVSDVEEEIPNSPENIEPVKESTPPPPAVKYEGGRRRVLKIKDETYEENGYLVTKKTHVYESCSEDEEEVKERIKEKAKFKQQMESKKKKNTKQTTLTNFFRKP